MDFGVSARGLQCEISAVDSQAVSKDSTEGWKSEIQALLESMMASLQRLGEIRPPRGLEEQIPSVPSQGSDTPQKDEASQGNILQPIEGFVNPLYSAIEWSNNPLYCEDMKDDVACNEVKDLVSEVDNNLMRVSAESGEFSMDIYAKSVVEVKPECFDFSVGNEFGTSRSFGPGIIVSFPESFKGPCEVVSLWDEFCIICTVEINNESCGTFKGFKCFNPGIFGYYLGSVGESFSFQMAGTSENGVKEGIFGVELGLFLKGWLRVKSAEMAGNTREIVQPILCYNPRIKGDFIGVLAIVKFEKGVERCDFSGNYGAFQGYSIPITDRHSALNFLQGLKVTLETAEKMCESRRISKEANLSTQVVELGRYALTALGKLKDGPESIHTKAVTLQGDHSFQKFIIGSKNNLQPSWGVQVRIGATSFVGAQKFQGACILWWDERVISKTIVGVLLQIWSMELMQYSAVVDTNCKQASEMRVQDYVSSFGAEVREQHVILTTMWRFRQSQSKKNAEIVSLPVSLRSNLGLDSMGTSQILGWLLGSVKFRDVQELNLTHDVEFTCSGNYCKFAEPLGCFNLGICELLSSVLTLSLRTSLFSTRRGNSECSLYSWNDNISERQGCKIGDDRKHREFTAILELKADMLVALMRWCFTGGTWGSNLCFGAESLSDVEKPDYLSCFEIEKRINSDKEERVPTMQDMSVEDWLGKTSNSVAILSRNFFTVVCFGCIKIILVVKKSDQGFQCMIAWNAATRILRPAANFRLPSLRTSSFLRRRVCYDPKIV